MDKNIDELLKNKNDKSKIDDFVQKNLSENQKNELKNILSDKNRIRQMLESSKAKEIFNKYMKD